MTLSKHFRLSRSAAIAALLVCSLLFSYKTASATYVANNLISDGVYLNAGAMNQAQIQAFLNGKGGAVASFVTYSARDGGNVPASQIIAEAAVDYGINPQVILATMQKEESLVTDPHPSADQVNYAMGYGCPDSAGCSGYAGFARQVDAATWQFRYNYEAINGRAYGGHAASEYPCRNATRYYNPGLYAGNNVTFLDENGTPYKQFVIANASTASLYCYTPHVGPYSETGYSGNYNFVTAFEAWFGSTQQSIGLYGWSLYSQQIYADAARTVPFSGTTTTVAPGGKLYARIKATNVGSQTWDQSFLHLGNWAPMDRSSPFYDSATWHATTRPARMIESSVAPGQTATFEFTMNAPASAGTYREAYNVVADGRAWLNDVGLSYVINVVNPIATPSSFVVLASGTDLKLREAKISADGQSVVTLQPDGNLVLFGNFVPIWGSGAHTGPHHVSMQTDGNLVMYNASNQALWSSGTDGYTGAKLVIQSDGNMVIIDSGNNPRWQSSTVFGNNPTHLGYVNTNLGTGTLFAGQQLQTADRRYKLIMQPDGNLVFYSPNRPIWQSGTYGSPATHVSLQPDGNLVIYDDKDHALWSTGSFGRGASHFYVQPDGNLVMYGADGRPSWQSGTFGQQ